MSLAKIELSDGSVESLKWLGLILMTGDHVNMYLFNGSLPYLFELGRIAMPLFIFVLAYNLARPNILETKTVFKVMKRLAFFGAIATIPFIALGQVLSGWWPLNILVTLLAITVIIYFLDKGGNRSLTIAVMLFFLSGLLVQFWWPAIALGISTWYFFRKQSLNRFIYVVIFCASLWVVNSNFWALAAFPVAFIATQISLKIPRFRLGFYIYYPAHLSLLWLLKFL